MKAMVCVEQGKPAKWEWREWPVRALGPRDVQVRIRAAGVNFPDRLASEGGYHIPTPPPYVPGLEAAGDVVAVGSEVAGHRLGDRVIIDGSSVLQGLFAEECVVEEDLLIPLPDGMNYAAGAAFPVVYATGYHGLVQRGRLEEGETLVVHGAGGGVGLAAMQIAQALGARVIGTVGSQGKVEALKALGFSDVIVAGDDLRDRLLELTGGAGADVHYDPVGGASFEASMRTVAKEGRILVIGAAGGAYAQVKTNHLLVKEAEVAGVLYGARLVPHIWKTLPMLETPAALDHLGNREVIGKIVLVPEDL